VADIQQDFYFVRIDKAVFEAAKGQVICWLE